MDFWRKLLERLRKRVVLADDYLAFVLVNVADLFLTGICFSLGGQELNWLAAWIIRVFGLRGLVAYKFLLVGLVIGICEAIFPKRPRAARGLILAGCAVYIPVILLQFRGLIVFLVR